MSTPALSVLLVLLVLLVRVGVRVVLLVVAVFRLDNFGGAAFIARR